MTDSKIPAGIHPIDGMGVPHDGCFCRNCEAARPDGTMTDVPKTTDHWKPDGPAVARAQEWFSDERAAGRCIFEVSNDWVARLLNAAFPVRHVPREPFVFDENEP